MPIAIDRERGNVEDKDYQRFRWVLGQRFQHVTGPLFTTDAKLWPIYLGAFPEEARQHHNCTACRRFLERYGGLATIGVHGEVTSAVWAADITDDEHTAAIMAMRAAVHRAKITGVFLSERRELGTEMTGVWAHLALELPEKSPALRTSRKRGEMGEDHKNVMRALGEYKLETLERVVELLSSDALYRSEKVLGPAKWLRDLAATPGNRSNIVWRAIATAPAGFCHPRSSMVGSLLDDIASGALFPAAAARFREKMHPLQYQRPQAAPKVGQIAAAERLVQELGIAPALARRFARIDEIETVWRPRAPAEPVGVFGHLLDQTKGKGVDVPGQHITWDKFFRTVLPDAIMIDVKLPALGNYCALVTAADPEAPPILQWDDVLPWSVGRRNPVNWYVYPRGSPVTQWGLSAGWAPVAALTLQPSMWHGGFDHQGKSVLAVIAGARDSQWELAGSALFPEVLRGEMHGARAVIEAHSRATPIAGHKEASACGLRFPEADLRVTSATGNRFIYRIDRWD